MSDISIHYPEVVDDPPPPRHFMFHLHFRYGIRHTRSTVLKTAVLSSHNCTDDNCDTVSGTPEHHHPAGAEFLALSSLISPVKSPAVFVK
jgi:hypothetical protein